MHKGSFRAECFAVVLAGPINDERAEKERSYFLMNPIGDRILESDALIILGRSLWFARFSLEIEIFAFCQSCNEVGRHRLIG